MMKDRNVAPKYLGAMAALFCASLASTMSLAQESVESFYEGKTITLYVGFSPGGGYDSYARFAAEFLGEHIPGKPTVIVENMPGGGGRLAAQYLYKVAPQDGTAISLILQSIGMDSAAGTIPGGVDASEFGVIGRLAPAYNLGVAWHTSGIKTFEDTLNKSLTFGSTGAGSASSFIPQMLNDLEGAKYEIIQGYKGGSAVRLAMESGEVDAMMPSLSTILSNRPEWFSDGLVSVIWQLSNERHPDFPDVVAIGELGDSADEKAMYRLVAGVSEIGRSIFTTPNVPPERLMALREAFDKMTQDPKFINAAAERNLELGVLSGAEVQEMLAEQMSASEGAIELLGKYLTGG